MAEHWAPQFPLFRPSIPSLFCAPSSQLETPAFCSAADVEALQTALASLTAEPAATHGRDTASRQKGPLYK